MRKIPVLMAGGKGERFWPLSRLRRPKQFLELNPGEGSFLSKTAARVLPLFRQEDLYVVTDQAYTELVAAHLPGLTPSQIIAEPMGRNTAACIGLAAIWLEHLYPGEEIIMVNLPADHFVREEGVFRRVLREAIQLAALPLTIVTMGIVPTRPETGYGYIRTGGEYQPGIYRVEAFIEKPERDRAERFLTDGRYLWNSGIYIWQVATIRALIARYMPALHQALERIQAAIDTPRYQEVLRQEYTGLEPESIDYGISEKILLTQRYAQGHSEESVNFLVLPCSFGWDDVGSWPALDRILPHDYEGNVAVGKHVGLDTDHCIIFAEDKLVATLGVDNLVIVQQGDAVLVCAKSRAQELKDLLRRIGAQEDSQGYL